MFALSDCNNFFASCEMVFNPKLEDKPLVVLSNNDGCIIARSPKAKALGIKMGEAAYLYQERKDIVMLSANFALYSDMSQRVMQILSSFSPDIESYSIDEAFLQLEDPDTAFQIRNKVKKWTGLPVSIGVGETKTLAKLATEIAKKGNGVFVLRDREKILNETALADIWGIGKSTEELLKRNGIYTAAGLAEKDDTWIRKLLGVTGYRTVLELRGTPCFTLNELPEKKKSIVHSRSFGQKIQELALLEEAVATFTARAAEKLREQQSYAGFLSVFISVNHYESVSCHVNLPNPSNDTPELITLAKEGLSKIYRPSLEYRKAGVILGDFSEGTQTDFLSLKKRRTKGMEVIDQINQHYDKPAIRFAAEGVNKHPWVSRRSHSSPKFTTSWGDLLKVFAIPNNIF